MKKQKRYNRYAKYGVLFCLPGLLGFVCFLLVPIFFSIFQSLFDRGGNFALFRNIQSLMRSHAFWLAMKNTVSYLLIGGGLANLLAFFLAWGLFSLMQKRTAGTGLVKGSWLLPMLVPTAVSVLFTEQLFAVSGPVNNWLHSNINWLTTSPYSFWIMTVLYVWKNFGYFVIVFLGAFGGIPYEEFEAARLDGSGSVRILRYIVLPQVLPSLFFTVVMSIVGVFKMNRESFLLFGYYPSDSAYMFQNFITNNLSKLEYSRAATASMLLLLVFSVMVGFMVKYSEREDGRW